jgi:hypothetical protein
MTEGLWLDDIPLWKWNLTLCAYAPGYARWQKEKTLTELFPVIRWLRDSGAIVRKIHS